MDYCNLGAWTLAAILLLAFAAFPHAVDAQEARTPQLIGVITMGDRCARCVQVKNRVHKHAGKFVVARTKDWPTYPDPKTGQMVQAPCFPWCYYSDNTWDDGEKFLNGYARVPEKPVTMTLYEVQ